MRISWGFLFLTEYLSVARGGCDWVLQGNGCVSCAVNEVVRQLRGSTVKLWPEGIKTWWAGGGEEYPMRAHRQSTMNIHACIQMHDWRTCEPNTLCMEFHNGRRSFSNLHFQGQAASEALVDCVSKVWWNHTSLTSRYCTLHSHQTQCLTNIWKQPAGNIEMTQWASCLDNIIRYVERPRRHTHTWSRRCTVESHQHCNEWQISAYSCITHTLILFCVVIMP